MKDFELAPLIIGAAVMVAALATLTVAGGWLLWIPLGLVAFVMGKATCAT